MEKNIEKHALRVDLDSELYERLRNALSPWGSQKVAFTCICEWICTVREADRAGAWLGAVMSEVFTPEQIISLGMDVLKAEEEYRKKLEKE